MSYPKVKTLSELLTWSHYVELLKIDDPLERSFYEKECSEEHWGVRELKMPIFNVLRPFDVFADWAGQRVGMIQKSREASKIKASHFFIVA